MEDGMVTTEHVAAYLDRYNAPGKFFVHESAVIELLAADILFCNSRRYVCIDGTTKAATLVLFVNCNDLFAWACADAEPVTLSELEGLYQAWKADEGRGVEQWVCLKRKMRPQYCVEQEWRKDGAWPDSLEALPTRATDTQAFGNPKIEPIDRSVPQKETP